MTTALQRLAARGRAVRQQDPDDAGASLILLTPTGRDTLDDVRRARGSVARAIILSEAALGVGVPAGPRRLTMAPAALRLSP